MRPLRRKSVWPMCELSAAPGSSSARRRKSSTRESILRLILFLCACRATRRRLSGADVRGGGEETHGGLGVVKERKQGVGDCLVVIVAEGLCCCCADCSNLIVEGADECFARGGTLLFGDLSDGGEACGVVIAALAHVVDGSDT